MSLSPARQHRLRIQAEQAARQGGSVRHAKGYDLMLMHLGEDRRRLKGVQSTVKKAEIKQEVLPGYAHWVDGVLAANGAQIGRHALKHGWVMPQGFNRNVQTLLAEEMADAAKAALLADTPFDAGLLLQTLDAVGGLDMPDQSRARLHKSLGWLLRESDPATALNHLKTALQLDERCGVKKDIEQLEKPRPPPN
ncbi:phage terminase small subunit [Mixta calida]|uniref:phage terminase small subunit n=1 Tax=Mixta calida TaxID=665913 RepID=UPI0029123265|nr:phage terminase small subunit [Mixta calida]MDU6416617.1 phage terminase small subunit [Mixta calida]